MTKRDQFKALAERRGQSLALSRFVSEANAPDAMVDGWPDPEDPDYPVTGRPEDQYATAVTIAAFIQPPRVKEGGEARTITVAGVVTEIALVAYVPYDVAIGHRDKVTWGGQTYLVKQIKPWHDEFSQLLYNEVALGELGQVSGKP
ncbi:MAG: hypothetical protein A2Y74_08530 [Actinobacteria bacterium RBG_13_63_9]|nr:MAG: hypothetical protein A2Y74_08530 [Actinobacteria bacterium RBG_13_63_9]